MAFNNVLLEKDGEIGILIVNRPKALNALNGETLTEIGLALDEIAKDEEIKVVILTGAGDKAFVAGADIVAMQNMTPMEAREFSLLGQRVMSKMETFSRPVICAINGFCLGGGNELAMCTDIRIATPKSRFGQPEVNLGVLPGFAGTQRLPRLVGKGRAKELTFTADAITAEEAYRIGLVNKVVEEDKLMEEAKKMAAKIASKGRIAVMLSKEAINEGLEMDLDKAMIHEADLFGLCFSTEERKEGMTAFIEKRPAKFTGR